MPITEDMNHYIASTFRAEDRAAAANLLAAATIEDGSMASPQLMRCALVGARGSLARLEKFVQLLRIDWRDVIMAGEYENQPSGPVRVRDLNFPFPGASNISFKADGPDGPRP